MRLIIFRHFIVCPSKNPSWAYRSHFPFAFSHHFFSSLTKMQAENTVSVYDFLLYKHHFSRETATRVASVWSRIRNLDSSDSVLLFLKETGLSQSQLENVVKKEPRVLHASLERTIKPKIKIFQDFGFSVEDICEIISNNPPCLFRSVNNGLLPAFSTLRSLLGSTSEVGKVLKKPGEWALYTDLEQFMIPNIEFLKSCGIDMEIIKKHAQMSTRLLLCSPTKLKNYVKRVDEIGFPRTSKMFVHAVRVLAALGDENWVVKLDHFRNLGFSEDDTLIMFRKAPYIFSLSLVKLNKVIEVVLATGKYDIQSIVRHPIALSNSLEKRINPRLKVLGILDNRHLIERWPSLRQILRMPESEFLKKFVHPYSNEVREAYYMVNSALKSKRDQQLLSSA